MEYQSNFHEDLKRKTDEYVYLVYAISSGFLREEIYRVTSQLHRSMLSAVLNYIEGFARMRSKVHKNFLKISYGSLQEESKYLLNFSFVEKYLNEVNYKKAATLADEIGAMLWGTIKKLKI